MPTSGTASPSASRSGGAAVDAEIAPLNAEIAPLKAEITPLNHFLKTLVSPPLIKFCLLIAPYPYAY